MHIDPELFTDSAVTDETRAFVEQIRDRLLTEPPLANATPDQVRAARRAGDSVFGPVIQYPRARTFRVPGPGGEIPLRVIDADDPAGVYVHIHGGGWVLGAADLSDVGNLAMMHAAGVTVVSIDYRLAPEHPYPAGPDDCVAAAEWLIDNASDEFGTDRLTIGGESAGANLAASVLLAVRDRTGFTDWRAANLVYGSYFPPGTPSVKNWTIRGLVLDPASLVWFADHYFGSSATLADAMDPHLSPLYGDLSDMPPALFTVGTWDPLVDDSLFMACRWVAAENKAELALYPGGIHAFDAFPIPIAAQARDRMHAFIKDHSSAPR
ncbi:MAG: alpha/beta hydrolase [Acidimicrobiia bacterium]